MSIERGTWLVRHWAPRFGLGEYVLTVVEHVENDESSAESYYEPNEQWGKIWVPADELYDFNTQELLILHELAHSLFWGDEEHNASYRTELNCDRVARLARPDSLWIEQAREKRLGSAYYTEKSTVTKLDRHKWLSVVTDGLPAAERGIITMLYFEGLSLREVGLELGLTRMAVSRLRDRALRRIGEYYGALDGTFGAEDSEALRADLECGRG